jgi:hypothetical protein
MTFITAGHDLRTKASQQSLPERQNHCSCTNEYPRRQKAITMLFWRIELAAVESGTPAIYDALINELNEWMISYRLLVKSRITRTANRKVSDETGSDKKEAVAMSAQTSATA